MPTYKVHSYDCRDIAEPLRLILTFAGEPFEDDRWPAPAGIIQAVKDKYWDIPILEVGTEKLTDGAAISRFLGTRLNLVSSDRYLEAKADEVIGFGEDLRYEFRRWLWQADGAKKEALRVDLVERIVPEYYMILNGIIEDLPGKFIAGNTPTWQDFYLANLLDILSDKVVGRELLSGYAGLKSVLDSVWEIPVISSYLERRPKTEL